jgi:hypothetical protein
VKYLSRKYLCSAQGGLSPRLEIVEHIAPLPKVPLVLKVQVLTLFDCNLKVTWLIMHTFCAGSLEATRFSKRKLRNNKEIEANTSRGTDHARLVL